MIRPVLLGTVLLIALSCQAQTALEIRKFTPAQKADWEKTIGYWSSNGNGTCMPIMEKQIADGKCTRFQFVADLSIGQDGKIKKVTVLDNRIVCADPRLRKQLLNCFVETLRDGTLVFTQLRGRVIRKAVL